MDVAKVYEKYHRVMVVVPVVLFVVLLFFLPNLKLGIDFTGGISVSFSSNTNVPAEQIVSALKSTFGVAEVSVTPVTGGYIVEMTYPPSLKRVYDLYEEWKKTNSAEALQELKGILGVEDVNNIDAAVAAYSDKVKEQIKEEIKRVVPDANEFVIEDIVPVLGADFWRLMMNIALWAVILLLIAILIYFRHPIPIVIMLVSGIFDGIAMLALMGLTNIPLTLSTMAILLMMVGYSIDTDVVASTFLFKRRKEGNVFKLAERAFKTGMTMSLTTLIAMVVIYAVGFLTRNIMVIRIANVMIYGVIADIIITWMFNTPLLILVGGKRARSA